MLRPKQGDQTVRSLLNKTNANNFILFLTLIRKQFIASTARPLTLLIYGKKKFIQHSIYIHSCSIIAIRRPFSLFDYFDTAESISIFKQTKHYILKEKIYWYYYSKNPNYFTQTTRYFIVWLNMESQSAFSNNCK